MENQCLENTQNGVPERGPYVEWAKGFGATESQAVAISRFLDQSTSDFDYTNEFNDNQFEQLQAIWDNRDFTQIDQVAAIIKLLGL